VVVVLVGADDLLDFDALVLELLDEVVFDVLLLVVPLQVLTGGLQLVLKLLHDLHEDALVAVVLHL